MKKILQYILKILSSMVLKKYKPEIIAITGSIGKTSTKEVVAQMLSTKYTLWKTKGNFNNEIGVPLTILGFDKSPNKSPIAWLAVILKGIKLIVSKNYSYPKKLILEMGADHPGDIENLVNFVPVKIGIVTKISKVHLEYFKTLSAVLKEKTKIFRDIPFDGCAILNNDDERLKDYKSQLKCRVMTYGVKNEADIWATDLQVLKKGDFVGMNFKIRYAGNVVPVFLPGALGVSQVYAFLAGASVCLLHGIHLVEISLLANKYFSPKGRTNLLKAINDAYVLDDTYNSSPDALKAAIDLLADLSAVTHGKKIAVLGDMLELGEESDELHKEIGEYILKNEKIDAILTIGEKAKEISCYIEKNNKQKLECVHFDKHEDLIKYLKNFIKSDDVALVKGSQGMRMERIVKEIMKDKKLAKDLLVRQDESWEKK